MKNNKEYKAIIYTSNTGSTARSAKLLGHELYIPVYRAFILKMLKIRQLPLQKHSICGKSGSLFLSGGVLLKIAVMEVLRRNIRM